MAEPPNYRDADECIACKHCKCTHCCGCCPSEYECTKHGHIVYECKVCDSFEEE